jgi:hypothetical protein
VDYKKIETMKDWSHPKSLKTLHGFLGLAGYYCKFGRNYGKIAALLTALLKNNVFNWNPAVDQSLQSLKYVMCTTPFLALLDFTNNCVLERDASRKGVGTVLMQDGRPFGFH